MTPSRRRLNQLEQKLDETLEEREENDDPLDGLVELPPMDTGLESKPLDEVLDNREG